MVKLINWKKASKSERDNIKFLLRELRNFDVVILLRSGGYVEYIKSIDLDTNERLIIRKEKRNKLHKELSRLHSEGFRVKLLVSQEIILAQA